VALLNIVQSVNETLRTEMRRNGNVVLLGEDIGKNGGVFRATAGLLSEFGPERVIDTPIAEDGIIGTAIGMAMNGLEPVVEIQFLDFIYPGFNQIVSELAKLRYRSGGNFPAHVVIRAPSGGGIKGGLYHSQSTEAYFTHTPGLCVATPSSPTDTIGLLRTAMRGSDPVMFLEPKRVYRTVKEEVPSEEEFAIPFGKAKVVREGTDVTVVTYGATVRRAITAANAVADGGISVEVIDLRTLSPWDRETVFESVKKTSRVIVAYEDALSWGFGAEISASIADECFAWLDAPVKRVASADTFVGYAPSLEDAILPQVDDFKQAYEDIVKY